MIQAKTFSEFYPFYLREHSNIINRRLHIVGTSIGACCVVLSIVKRNPWIPVFGLLQGYAWAWVGHFVFQKNKPATFTHPLWSFMGDWRMWFETVTLQRRF
ncbi:hypothetical protein EDD86DRAFT_61629 [Gorgonomyces haynaldii]|nr:hypothetical protein EDD86DRAFT_61629 [Gorgonomyces haynaldii]